MIDKSKSPHPHHIVLTSHPGALGNPPIKISWGAKTLSERGPIIATTSNAMHRNAIGAHSGSYSIYRALAMASRSLDPEHIADLTNTAPVVNFGPFPSWMQSKKIISLDPWGHLVPESFSKYFKKGFDIRPTIAITKAHIRIPEIEDAIQRGALQTDSKILSKSGNAVVIKAAVEPVWYLPAIAERFGCKQGELRRNLFEHTGGMYPELITRPDLEVFLPPIGGMTVYIFGDYKALSNPNKSVTARVHDECNGSDVFGSDICTCRPYLIHGIELCIEEAQKGGVGVIVYNRKEGRGLGEVTKFLVYNARKRQKGGDVADKYFERTECVAGVQDMRFQELMPDVLHWLGMSKIDRFVSMSDMKYNAIVKSGIRIHKRVTIPSELIPTDAHVEMEAKKAAGYLSKKKPSRTELRRIKGRSFHE